MKNSARLIWSIVLKTTVFTIVMGYMSHVNFVSFQSGRVSGLPDGHIRVIVAEQSHLDLLLPRRGGVYFNHYGEKIHVYFAHYMRDELVLHERIVSISTIGDNMFSGSALWGVTTENNSPSELRVRLMAGGVVSQNYFDLSLINFEARMFSGALIENGPIEPGRRNILELWGTGSIIWIDGNMFEPERLRESEHTAILYVVFD